MTTGFQSGAFQADAFQSTSIVPPMEVFTPAGWGEVDVASLNRNEARRDEAKRAREIDLKRIVKDSVDRVTDPEGWAERQRREAEARIQALRQAARDSETMAARHDREAVEILLMVA